MIRIPNFTLSNYEEIMSAPYEEQTTSDRLNWWDLCDVMLPSYLMSHRDIDARELGEYLDQSPPIGTTKLGNQEIDNTLLLQHTKLACPTLWTCHYFSRDCKSGAHGGVDIILPQGTPIPSFTDGVVIRVKQRDGQTNNEGNCIVVKSDDDYVVSYEHLQEMHVAVGDRLDQGEILGTCGSTGNSTQYHLHLQVDDPDAPFHPFWSEREDMMLRWTIDPLPYLRSLSPQGPFIDLPMQSPYNESILKLHQAGIVNGHNHQVYPEHALQRYEAALLLDRILLQYALYDQLPVINDQFEPYSDVGTGDPELTITVERLQKYGVMKGHNGKFYPHQPLTGEQFIALLGRVFYGLQDSEENPRRRPYQEKFEQEHLIATHRPYIGQAIPRKEVFLLLYRLLTRMGHLT